MTTTAVMLRCMYTTGFAVLLFAWLLAAIITPQQVQGEFIEGKTWAATAMSLSPDNRRIPGNYIVAFKKHVGPQKAEETRQWARELVQQRQQQSLARDHDVTSTTLRLDQEELAKDRVHHDYRMNRVRGFSGRFSEATLNEIRARPEVDYIEEDQPVHAAVLVEDSGQSPQVNMGGSVIEESPPSWGIDRIDQNYLPLNEKYSYDEYGGDGIDVYVIDSGVYTKHNDFGGRASLGVNLRTDEGSGDFSGHGTHVSGTIAGTRYGVAKRANIIDVKMLKADNTGVISDLIAGIDWVVRRHAQSGKSVAIVNLSLITGYSASLNAAIESAVEKNIVVVVAAGNSNTDACQTSPGSAASAIRVGASTITDDRAWFSNYGPCLDIFAPGNDIWSAGLSNPSASARKTGTSMASPHVAGTMALWAHALQNSTAAAHFKGILQSLATPSILKNMVPATRNLLLYTSPPSNSKSSLFLVPSSSVIAAAPPSEDDSAGLFSAV